MALNSDALAEQSERRALRWHDGSAPPAAHRAPYCAQLSAHSAAVTGVRGLRLAQHSAKRINSKSIRHGGKFGVLLQRATLRARTRDEDVGQECPCRVLTPLKCLRLAAARSHCCTFRLVGCSCTLCAALCGRCVLHCALHAACCSTVRWCALAAALCVGARWLQHCAVVAWQLRGAHSCIGAAARQRAALARAAAAGTVGKVRQ